MAIKSALGDLPSISEDLGTVVPGVDALRDELGLPGMRVLQFGFGNETISQPVRTSSSLPRKSLSLSAQRALYLCQFLFPYLQVYLP